jgi:TonB-linked SusC/RagA family outer membrane protein
MYLSALCKSCLRDYRKPLTYWGVTKTQLHSNKTIILAMKLTAILLFAACLQVSAKTYSQTVTLNVQNAPLDKVVKEIEKQTKVNFFYEEGLFQNAKPVTVSVNNSTLEQTLELCFRQQPFEFKVVKNTVFIKRKQVVNIEQAKATEIKNGDLKGRVLTREGEPLVSANVVNKHTGKGTTTDANGNFYMNDVKLEDIIVVSYTGYASRYIKVSEFVTLNLVMEPAVSQLDQVVMQAYGQTTQRFNTGNIAKVSSEEISQQPIINPLQALQGRVAGLVIKQTSGYGSAPFKVELRGRNNLNSLFTSDPLYIIDGVPITISDVAGNSSYLAGSSGFLQNSIYAPSGGQSPLFSINPNDIESIEVLKDADATSIYGSRAANGVILITTKKGKPGKTKLNGSFSRGISAVTHKWDMLNTEQYLEMRKEAFDNDGKTMTTSNAYDFLVWDTTRYTDWQKYVWGNTGKAIDAQLGLSGGNNQITYRIGTGYDHRTDITAVSGADERFSISSNISYKTSNQRFSLSFNNSYSFSKSNMVFMPGSSTALLPPNAPDVYDVNGKLNFVGWKPGGYPFSNLFQPYTSKTKFLNSNLILNYEITKGLDFRTSFGYNSANLTQTLFIPIVSLNPTLGFDQTGSASFGNNVISNWIVEPQLEYRRFIAKGKFNILIGSTIQKNITEGSDVNGDGYTTDFLLHTISNAPNQYANDFWGQYRYAGIFARANYNFANKYVLNLSARRDGSSRFGEGKQFGNFGAIGAAWILSEEKFIKNHIKFLSFAKIRGSYGTTGNDAVGDYKYLTRWSSSGISAYGGVSPLVPIQHSNTQYHWPTNRKLEAAVDMGLFNDKISFSVAWYRNRCNDQLLLFPIAIYTGFGNVTANSPANVQNMGWEFNLGGKIINSKKIAWNFTLNSGINKNKLLSYPNIEQSPYAQQFIVGQPLNIIRKLHFTGVDPQTGFYSIEDKNKDGVISTTFGNTDDRYVLKIDPTLSGGLGTTINYSGIELSLFFSIIKQKFGLNSFATNGYIPGGITNTSLYIFNNRWRKPGDVSQFAKFTTTPDNSFSYFYNSDGVYTDASYIRLSTFTLGYNLPYSLIKTTGFESIRFSINAQNLFTITKYKGIDPETQNFGGMPPAKIIIAGINFNF